MIKYALILSLLSLAASGAASAACTGSDPALTTVTLKGMTSDSGLNHYTIAGTVTNAGTNPQASDVLQFVDIYKGPVKLDSKGIPPLKPGESYTFTYVADRSSDAGNGTTKLTFKIDMQNAASSSNCDTSNDTATLTF